MTPYLCKYVFTFCSNGDQFDALAGDVVEGLVDVGDLVKAHLAPVGLGERLARYDLQEEHELEAIAEIVFYVIYRGARFSQMAVAPGCECLKTRKVSTFDSY